MIYDTGYIRPSVWTIMNQALTNCNLVWVVFTDQVLWLNLYDCTFGLWSAGVFVL